MANHAGPNNSHRQGYKMASAMPADSIENLQLSKRNDGAEPATIARDRSLQSTKGKYRLLIKENVFLDSYTMVFEEQNLKKKRAVLLA